MGDARCSDFCDLNFDETLHSNFLLKEGRCRRRPLLGGFSGASLEGKILKRVWRVVGNRDARDERPTRVN
jgi:hypothetical protein